MSTLASVTEVKDLYQVLCEQITLLQYVLRSSNGSYYTKLPIPEHNTASDNIIVQNFEGSEAVPLCVSSFADFARYDKQNPNFSVRHPGVLLIDHLPVQQIKAANETKAKLFQLLSTMKGKARGDFMRMALPNVSSFHLTREIKYITQTPHRISFTWAAAVPQVHRLTIDDAVTHILHSTGLSTLTEEQSKRLASVQGQIYLRRSVATHPRVNITLKKGSSPIMRPATLPIIVPYQLGTTPPAIRLLADFDAKTAADREKRSDTKTLLPIFERLNLFEAA